ncbi:hypothetical protein GCM10017044_14880 [Kordiimonas sediminis]|uniref:histidine kinase n=1 Tax=Kordiimonas sediminis TaxID=1735581 RepID=A0A919AT61_9PROT|nr:tetratricopeptide repeat protein [Kordiimonas sediminis]GHF20982.1 hypothetical protein GCM10017044_14880 [Kordiimonas sediminis]
MASGSATSAVIVTKAAPRALIETADALLERVLSAPDNDVYTRIHQLRSEIASTESPARKKELYTSLLFNLLSTEFSDKMREIGHEAHAFAKEQKDYELELISLSAQTFADEVDGDLIAPHTYQKVLLQKALDEDQLLATHFINLVIALHGPKVGNLLEGVETLLEIDQQLPDDYRSNQIRSTIFQTLGYIYVEGDDLQSVLRYYHRAMDIAETSGVPIDRETIIYNVAFGFIGIGDLEEADRFYAGLQQVIDENGNEDGGFYAQYGRASVAFEQQRFEEALEFGQSARQNYEAVGTFSIYLDQLLADSYAAIGNIEAAIIHHNEVLKALDDNPDYYQTELYSRSLFTEAQILYAQQNYKKGYEVLRSAMDAQKTILDNEIANNLGQLTANFQLKLDRSRAVRELVASEGRNRNLFILLLISILTLGIFILIIQRRFTKRLRQSYLQLKHANNAKSDFLANMSHELRTPLNAIIGFSDIMAEELYGKHSTPQYHDYAQNIQRSGQHLLSIINDILDLSKIEAGQMEMHEEVFNLPELIDDTTYLVEQRAANKGLDLSITQPDYALPDMRGDVRLIKQIILNVLTNAIKFTPAGGTVTVSYLLGDTIDDALSIIITDTGTGMSAEELEVAITPFGQAGNTLTRSTEGTGLGLPLVSSLMKMHGGKMVIESEPGVGTKVSLQFPFSRLIRRD